MTQQLVTDILDSDNDSLCEVRGVYYRLRGVHGGAVMPDVLGGVEHSEGQASQEVSRREEASHRPELEPSHTLRRLISAVKKDETV